VKSLPRGRHWNSLFVKARSVENSAGARAARRRTCRPPERPSDRLRASGSLLDVGPVRIEVRPDHSRVDLYPMARRPQRDRSHYATWDKVVVDRTEELSSWVDFCYQIRKRGVTVYAYANNHYQGHGPATIRQFIGLWREKGLPEIGKAPAVKRIVAKQHTLFEGRHDPQSFNRFHTSPPPIEPMECEPVSNPREGSQWISEDLCGRPYNTSVVASRVMWRWRSVLLLRIRGLPSRTVWRLQRFVRRPCALGAVGRYAWPSPTLRIQRIRIPEPVSQPLRTAVPPGQAGPAR